VHSTRMAILPAAFALAVGPAWSQSGRLDIENAWLHAAPGGAPTGAAYVTIRSPTSDRLVGAATPVAGKAGCTRWKCRGWS
jgi:copper(I)-binding protein